MLTHIISLVLIIVSAAHVRLDGVRYDFPIRLATILKLLNCIRSQALITADAKTKSNDTIWENLGDLDGNVGHKAIWALIDRPGAAISLLKRHLVWSRTYTSTREIGVLVEQLDMPRYSTRQLAFRTLQTLGPAARPALEQMLISNRPLTPEQRRRVELLLADDDMDGLCLSPGKILRLIRSIQVLEQINTVDARAMLETIRTHPISNVRRHACAALTRLDKKIQTEP